MGTERLAGYDVQETAEVLNNFLYLINRLGNQNPAALLGMVSRFTSAIDDDALADIAQLFFNDADPYLRPVARSVVPGLVTWVCRVLKPEDDAYEDDAARARLREQGPRSIEPETSLRAAARRLVEDGTTDPREIERVLGS